VANNRCRNSQLILPAVRTVGLFVVLAAMSSPISARSETRSSDVHRAVDNVVFDLWSTVEGITDCLRTTRGAALSGPYGVTITAPSKPYTWQDDLPKVITVADDYFAVPLRIELKPTGRCWTLLK
jgi:hypothetical protein